LARDESFQTMPTYLKMLTIFMFKNEAHFCGIDYIYFYVPLRF